MRHIWERYPRMEQFLTKTDKTMRTLSYLQALRLQSQGKDYVTLAGAPNDEPCTPAGGSIDHMRMECAVLRGQMIRIHGDIPDGAEFFIMRNEHDFGTYLELCVSYKEMDGEEIGEDCGSFGYAMKCEGGIPDNWDTEAIAQLAAMGHGQYVQNEVIQETPGSPMSRVTGHDAQGITQEIIFNQKTII